jgi:hypothetical protein
VDFPVKSPIHKKTVTHEGTQMLQDVKISYTITWVTITTLSASHVGVRKKTALSDPAARGKFNWKTSPPFSHEIHVTWSAETITFLAYFSLRDQHAVYVCVRIPLQLFDDFRALLHYKPH